MVFSLQTVSRPVISLQTVKPTSVYNMPQDPGQPLLKNTRKHFVETFFSHPFFYNVPIFFVYEMSGFFSVFQKKLLFCQWWSRTHCRVFSASFNSFHVHLISFHVHLISFHVHLISFHVHLISFHVHLISFHVHLISFHVHLISFHVHLISFHVQLISFHVLPNNKHFTFTFPYCKRLCLLGVRAGAMHSESKSKPNHGNPAELCRLEWNLPMVGDAKSQASGRIAARPLSPSETPRLHLKDLGWAWSDRPWPSQFETSHLALFRSMGHAWTDAGICPDCLCSQPSVWNAEASP